MNTTSLMNSQDIAEEQIQAPAEIGLDILALVGGGEAIGTFY